MKKGVVAAGILANVLGLLIWAVWAANDAPADAGPPGESTEQYKQRLGRSLSAGPVATAAAGADAGSTIDAGTWVALDVRGSVVLDGRPTSATVHLYKDVVTAGDDGKFSWRGQVPQSEGLYVWAERGALRSASVQPRAPESGRPTQVQLVLTEPIEIVGHVLGKPDGRPLAGMKVTLLTAGGEELVTDEKGGFSSHHLAPGFTEISVAGDAHWAPAFEVFSLEAGRVNEVQLSLVPFHPIAGHVVSAAQVPVEGAVVKMARVDTGRKTEARTDADGAFRFENAAGIAYTISAEHSSGRSGLVLTAPKTDLVLVLAAASSLEVTVKQDGTPIEGLECSVTSSGPMGGDYRRTTDTRGKVRFEAIPATTWNVFARHPKARWHSLGSTITRVGDNTFIGEMGKAGRRLEVQVLDGVVHGPVEAAEVTIADLTRETDDEGRAVFEDLDPDDELRFSVTAEGYPAMTGPIPPATQSMQIDLDRWRVLTGLAVDGEGRPVRELSIDDRRIDTGADGRFEELISSSQTAESSIFTCPSCAKVPVKIPAGKTDVDLGKVVLGEGGTIHFTVKTPDGKPAAFAGLFKVNKAKPWLSPTERKEPRMIVDVFGQARVRPGETSCTVAWVDGYAPSTRDSCPHDVKAGQTLKVELQLRAPAFIEGVVRKKGMPAGGLIVGETEEDLVVITDERGKYRLGPLSPGVHHVAVVAATDGVQAEVKPVTLAEGVTRTLDFGPASASRVVVEWVGKPSAQLKVAAVFGHFDYEQLKSKGSREFLMGENVQLRMAPEGSEVVFESLLEGEWTVFVLDDSGLRGQARFTVSSGQDQRVTVKPAAAK